MTNTDTSFVYDASVESMTVHTLFDPVVTDQLTRADLVRLAAGVAAVIRVRNFLPVEVCAEIMENLERHQMGRYDFTPPMAKLGSAAYDHYRTGELGSEYFEQAKADIAARRTLLANADPLDLVFDKLAAAWGDEVTLATANGRPLFAGIIREINNGARLHFDEIARECPTALDVPPVSQFAFNCHIAMPPTGGEAVVVRRRWRPSDEQHRDGYGYQSYLANGEPTVAIRPEVGDAILFDPRNFHRVEPIAEGRRVSLSFFLGVTGAGPLIAWS